jgi:hypothetical protein
MTKICCFAETDAWSLFSKKDLQAVFSLFSKKDLQAVLSLFSKKNIQAVLKTIGPYR